MTKTLKRIIKDYVKNNKKSYIFLFILSIIIAFGSILEPFFIKEIIGQIEKIIKTDNIAVKIIIFLFVIWLAYTLIFYSFKGVVNYFISKNLLNSYNNIFKEKSEKLLKMDYQTYLSHNQGEIYKTFDRGIEWSFFLMQDILTKITQSLTSIIFIAIILFMVNWKLAIATLAMVPVMLFIGLVVNRRTVKKQRQVNEKRNEAFGILQNSLTNLSLVKTLTLEDYIKKELAQKLNFANLLQLQVHKGWTFAELYISILVTLSRIFVLSLGIYLLVKGEIDFATLFFFFTFIGYIYFPLGFILNSFKNLQKWLTGIEKFYELFDNLKLDLETGKLELKNVNGEIQYKNVYFSYKNKEVLKNINIHIKPGEKIALVGPTGAGKSTLINLLLRFLEAKKGEITIDNLNIKDISKKSLRKNIGLVMQDNSLFNTTVRQNLLFAKPDATEEELIQALKNAQADFVFKLDKQLDTEIGERGLKLSGGEKQRISITRLFLKNPKIIVLDEATSALDNKTEKLVQKALDNLMKNRTSIIIAHRLSTIENANKILVLDNGQIVEKGKYNELIAKKGKFYQLANPEHLILQ